MTLSALHGKRLPTQFPATGLISTVLDSVKAALDSATYYDGTARVPGVGSAWAAQRWQNVGVTETVYADPPVVTALSQRVIFAGDVSGAKNPTMRTPDSKGAAVIYCSVNKNSGAFNAWDAALPFTTGQFFGFWRFVACAAVTVVAVVVYETEETLEVYFETATGTIYGGMVGAILDPQTTAAADGESDGRGYGVITNGTSGAIGGLFTTAGGTGFLCYNGGDGGGHAGVFTPSLGTIKTMTLMFLFQTDPSATTLLTPSGAPVTPAIWYRDTASDRCLGRLREVCYCTDARARDVLRTGGVDNAYLAGGSSIGVQATIAILA